jgi:hypothetical protein
MALGLANLGHALFLSLLLFLALGHLPPAAQPAGPASRPSLGPPAGLLVQALQPDEGLAARAPQAGRPTAGSNVADLARPSVAGDATPISERRARAVAMTVFSLGTVVGAGFLAVFLIKRLL